MQPGNWKKYSLNNKPSSHAGVHCRWWNRNVGSNPKVVGGGITIRCEYPYSEGWINHNLVKISAIWRKKNRQIQIFIVCC